MLRQWSFTGRVLPSAVANTLCRDLSVNEMLEMLNVPGCTPGSPRYKAWEYFIAENCDLGTTYAHLRYLPPDIDIGKHVTEAREYDNKMRRDLLEKREIGEYAPPRRVWDLRANRVVPWWVASKRVWAISHAWVADENLKYEKTPINGYEWPVPMPEDADLDLIRIEMLNLGAEYVWLDVLCLRQVGEGSDAVEILHRKEWKVDLPIIGWVYQKIQNVRLVVCYLSGLGLPLSFKTDRDFEDERCWFNRAWTLQETPGRVLIGGRTCFDHDIDQRFMTEELYERLEAQLLKLRYIQQWTKGEGRIFHFLEEMKKRKSSKPVDKVTGLVYLLQLKHIPIYNADQCEEGAWTELLNVSDGQLRATFFFLYPKPNGMKSWRPSWQQLMTETFPNFPDTSRHSVDVSHVHWTKENGDWYDGPRMEACHVRGFADETWHRQRGTLVVKNSSGKKYIFRIVADVGCTMPDGLYTLLGVVRNKFASSWVVGKVEEPEGEFRKVSEVRMKVGQTKRLQSLSIYEVTTTFLL